MEVSTHGRAGFATQANALFRKSLTYQKRNRTQNLCLLITPLVIVGFFATVEHYMRKLTESSESLRSMEVRNPVPWPPALKIPPDAKCAVRSKYMPFSDLPPPCRVSGNCPVTFLLTGANQSFVMSMAEKMFPPVSIENPSDMDRLVLANPAPLFQSNYLVDVAFQPDSPSPLYYLQTKCKANSSFPYPTGKEVKCVEGLKLWRNSSSAINKEVYKGNGANKQNKIDNNFGAALDFSNTNKANFNVTLWSEPSRAESASSFNFSRLPRLVNMASNVYLQALQGSGTQILFEFMKEVPTTLSISASLSTIVDLFLRMTTVDYFYFQ